jgi:hypothetical protein
MSLAYSCVLTLISAMMMEAFVKKALTIEKQGANSTYIVAAA